MATFLTICFSHKHDDVTNTLSFDMANISMLNKANFIYRKIKVCVPLENVTAKLMFM